MDLVRLTKKGIVGSLICLSSLVGCSENPITPQVRELIKDFLEGRVVAMHYFQPNEDYSNNLGKPGYYIGFKFNGGENVRQLKSDYEIILSLDNQEQKIFAEKNNHYNPVATFYVESLKNNLLNLQIMGIKDGERQLVNESINLPSTGEISFSYDLIQE
ncbi:MAG: hypothetical protein Q8P15_00495 [Nanoarchaeota archaeon]|nr:hypothetical protein [Nanoarchaeota archaeon]